MKRFAIYCMVQIILGIACLVISLPAQTARIQGQILNETGEPLPGANVYLRGTVFGSATNAQGRFEIPNVPAGDFTLVISLLGYREKEIPLSAGVGDVLDMGTIRLMPSPLVSEPVVVTAGKYQQKIREVPASISTISREELSIRNIISLERALQYVPGVNMNASQVNIRGSTGYSRGIGSRVMLLMDGVPFLTGDTREINFDVIPVYFIDRIEVLKGAGSALYGSSALGGVINVITRNPGDIPSFYAKTYGGWYSEPYYSRWRWTDETRYLNGQEINISGRYRKTGLMLGGGRVEDESFRRNDWRRRYTATGKLSLEISPYQQLTISGNFMDQKRANFLYWRDLNHALEPPENQFGEWVESRRYFISSHYRHIWGKEKIATLRGMWFRNRFEDNIGGDGNRSLSDNAFLESQFNSRLGAFYITAGLEGNFNSAESNIFGNQSATGMAAYLQEEINLSKKWQFTGGMRLDYYHIDANGDGYQFSPRVGLLFRPDTATVFRASAGRGFRAPSLAEIFTSTTVSGLRVIPNPDLVPERSFSAEIGWNRTLGKEMIADMAAFYSHFNNLIEGTFLQSGEIQFRNVTRARLYGAEVSLNGRFFNRRLQTRISYTYVHSRDLIRKDFLQFRPRHLLYLSSRLQLFGFEWGGDYRFISKYDRIDENFLLIIPDADAQVDAHVLDVRLLKHLRMFGQPFSVSVQINNLLQYHYTELIGSLAPIRHYVFTLATPF